MVTEEGRDTPDVYVHLEGGKRVTVWDGFGNRLSVGTDEESGVSTHMFIVQTGDVPFRFLGHRQTRPLRSLNPWTQIFSVSHPRSVRSGESGYLDQDTPPLVTGLVSEDFVTRSPVCETIDQESHRGVGWRFYKGEDDGHDIQPWRDSIKNELDNDIEGLTIGPVVTVTTSNLWPRFRIGLMNNRHIETRSLNWKNLVSERVVLTRIQSLSVFDTLYLQIPTKLGNVKPHWTICIYLLIT